jgi:hypothetical protein
MSLGKDSAMEQMLIWSMVYQEIARRKQRPPCEDAFYRSACNGPTRRLLRTIWPRFAGGQ